MDINPILIAAIGAVIGGFAKFVYDNWSGSIAWKRGLQANTRKKIQEQASVYHQMSNYAKVISDNLNSYLQIKSDLQILSLVPCKPIKSVSVNPVYASMDNEAAYIAKVSLFNAGKFIRTLTDHFLGDGGNYFLPDWWASQSLEAFQYALLNILPFEPFLLLKYIKKGTDAHEFFKELDSSKNTELKNCYSDYLYWLSREDIGVKELSDYANAYDDLFDQQIDRFYKNWYERMEGWREVPNVIFNRNRIKKYESNKNIGDKTDFSKISPSTDKLIIHHLEIEEGKKLQLIELKDDIDLISVNSLINTGWKHYSREEYQLAKESYINAKKILKKEKKNVKILFYKRKMSIILNNLGNVYTNKGIIKLKELKRGNAKDNKNLFEEAENCFNKAELKYIKALDFIDNKDIYFVNFGILYYNLGQLIAESIRKKPEKIDIDQGKKAEKSYIKSIEQFNEAIKVNSRESFVYQNFSSQCKDISYYYHLIGNTYCKKIELHKLLNKDIGSKALKKDKRNAIENYRKAISINPTEHIFYLSLSKLYENIEKLDKNSESVSNRKFRILKYYYKCKGIRKAKYDRYVDKKILHDYGDELFKSINEFKASKSEKFVCEECKKAIEIYKNLKLEYKINEN